MSKYRDLERAVDTIPESWTDALQEFIGTFASHFRLELATSTSLKIAGGSDNAQVGIGINGKWRYNAADVTAAHPGGGAGEHDVYVTASANSFSETPSPDTDNTVYSFGMEIRTSGTPSTTHYRKIGTVIWNGSAITEIKQTVGSLYQQADVKIGTTVALLGQGRDGRAAQLRVGSSPYEFLGLVYDATLAKWVSQPVARVSIPRVAPGNTSGAYIEVQTQPWGFISDFKALYDAGLRPQFHLMGHGFGTMNIAPYLGGFDLAGGGSITDFLAAADGNSIAWLPSATTFQSTGWIQPTLGTAPTTEDHAYVTPRFKVGATGTLINGELLVRLVST